MEFLERDLEDIIWEASYEQLSKAGLELKGKRFRQLRIGNYGIADIVTLEKEKMYNLPQARQDNSLNLITITVYELKKDKIGISAFLQAVEYIQGIKSYIEKRNLFEECELQYCITLIGRDVDKSGSFIYLPNFLNSLVENITAYAGADRSLVLNYYIYKYGIDGLKFSEILGYKLKNEGF